MIIDARAKTNSKKIIASVVTKILYSKITNNTEHENLIKLKNFSNEVLVDIVLEIERLKSLCNKDDASDDYFSKLVIKLPYESFGNKSVFAVLPQHYFTRENPALIRNTVEEHIPIVTAVSSDNIQNDTLACILSIEPETIIDPIYLDFWIDSCISLIPHCEKYIKSSSENSESHFILLVNSFLEMMNSVSDDVASFDYINFANYLAAVCDSTKALEKDKSYSIDSINSIYDLFGYFLYYLDIPMFIKCFSLKKFNKTNIKNNLNKFYKKTDGLYSRVSKTGVPLDKAKLLEAKEKYFSNETYKSYKDIDKLEKLFDGYVSARKIDRIKHFANKVFSKFDWKEYNLEQLFSIKSTPQKIDYIKKTEEFLHDNLDASNADDEYKDLLATIAKNDNEEDILSFFNKYKNILENDKKLFRHWEKLSFPSNLESNNFILALYNAIVNSLDESSRIVSITLNPAKNIAVNDIIKSYDQKVLATFSLYYGSILNKLTCNRFKFINIPYLKDNDTINPFTSYIAYLKEYKGNIDENTKKSSLTKEISFNVSIVTRNVDDLSEDKYSYKITWTPTKTDYFGFCIQDDIEFMLSKDYLLSSKLIVNLISQKGVINEVSLNKPEIFSSDKLEMGKLFKEKNSDNKLNINLKERFLNTLEDCYIENEDKEELINLFDDFSKSYREALEYFIDAHNLKQSIPVDTLALHNDDSYFNIFKEQEVKYIKLLNTIKELSFEQDAKIDLLDCVQKLGVFEIDTTDYAIIAPWHPERLRAITIQNEFMYDSLYKLIYSDNHIYSKTKILNNLENILFSLDKPEIIAATDKLYLIEDTVNYHSLAKIINNKNLNDKFNFVHGHINSFAHNISMHLCDFVAKNPTAYGSLNIALYDCYDLPFIDSLVRAIKDNATLNKINCNLDIYYVSAESASKLHKHYLNKYSNLLNDSNENYNLIYQNKLISNLKISILNYDDKARKNFVPGIKNYDFGILYKVISLYSDISWYKRNVKDEIDFDKDLNNTNYKCINKEDLSIAAKYLVNPHLDNLSKDYIDAVRYLSSPGVSEYLLPIEKVSLKEHKQLQDFIKSVHSQCDTIISLDELSTQSQLQSLGIDIISYKKTANLNIIESADRAPQTLNSILISRLNNLSLNVQDKNELANALIQQAKEISGDIIIRASKSEVHASELIGLALSKVLIDKISKESGLFKDKYADKSIFQSYYMLDNYKSLFFDKLISDILYVEIAKINNKFVVGLKVVESKFISENEKYNDLARHSQEQTKHSVQELFDMLVSPEYKVSRNIWLSEFSKILFDKVNKRSNINILQQAERAILNNEAIFMIAGSSFIFASSDKEINIIQEDFSVKDITVNRKQNLSYNLKRLDVKYVVVKDLLEQISNNILANNTINLENINVDLSHPYLEYKDFDNYVDLFYEDSYKDLTYNNIYDEDVETREDLEIVEDTNEQESYITLTEESSIKTTSHLEDLVSDIVKDKEEKDHKSLDSKPISRPIDDIKPNLNNIKSIKELADKMSVISDDSQKSNVIVDNKATWSSHIQTLIDKYQDSNVNNAIREEKLLFKDKLIRKMQDAFDVLGFKNTSLISCDHTYVRGFILTYKGDTKFTTKNIMKKQENFKTTFGINLLRTLPSFDGVKIFIEYDKVESVNLFDLWAIREFNYNNLGVNCSFVLGIDENNNNLVYINQIKGFKGIKMDAPHGLVCGASGSGKSTMLNSFILDIAATNKSKNFKLILIDPKDGVEFNKYSKLPHLLNGDIVTKPVDSIAQFKNLYEIMEERYSKMAQYQVRDINDYNQLVPEEQREPYILLIHDEFASWSVDDDYKKSLHVYIQKLAYKARAAGIFLYLATQRPSANVLDIGVRDNLGNRIAFKMENAAFSKNIIDNDDAINLNGNGHFIAKINGTSLYGQAPYISDEQINELVEAIILDD